MKRNDELSSVKIKESDEKNELNERISKILKQKASVDEELKTFKKNFNEEIANLRADIIDKDKDIEKLEESLRSKERDIASKIYEIENLNGEILELQDKIKIQKQEIDTQKFKVKENEVIIAKLKEDPDQLEYSSQSQEVVISQVAHSKAQSVSGTFEMSLIETQNMKNEIEELQTNINEKDKELNKLKYDNKGYKVDLKTLQTQLQEKNAWILESQETLNKMTVEVEKVRKEKEVLIKENLTINTLKSDILKKDEQIVNLFREIESLKDNHSAEIKKFENQIDSYESELKQAQADFMNSAQSSEKFSSGLEKRVQILDEKNKSLQIQVNQLKSSLSEKEKSIAIKLETITNLQNENAKLKSENEEYEETTNSLSDALTKTKVENGELSYKIKRMEDSKSQYDLDSWNEQETTNLRIVNLSTRVNDLEEENRKLRKTITVILFVFFFIKIYSDFI